MSMRLRVRLAAIPLPLAATVLVGIGGASPARAQPPALPPQLPPVVQSARPAILAEVAGPSQVFPDGGFPTGPPAPEGGIPATPAIHAQGTLNLAPSPPPADYAPPGTSRGASSNRRAWRSSSA
jgi:hypothetical protein